MSATKKCDLVDEMLTELGNVRITKQTQMANIADVSEKSNNILLQIESSQNTKPVQDDSISNRCVYSKDTLSALAKSMEMFERLITKTNEAHLPPGDLETYITTTKVRIDFLGSAVRKLLALNDTVNQMRSDLRVGKDQDDFDIDISGNGEENSSE